MNGMVVTFCGGFLILEGKAVAARLLRTRGGISRKRHPKCLR